MKWFYNMKIGTKLLSSFIIVALIAGIIGYVGIKNIRTINAADTEMYKNMTVPIGLLTGITDDFQRIRVNVRDLILAKNQEDKMKIAGKIDEYRKDIDLKADIYEKTIQNQKGKDLFKEFKDAHKAFGIQLDRVIELGMAGKVAEVEVLISENGDSGKASRAEQDAIANLVEYKIGRAKEISDRNTALSKSAVEVMIIVLIIGVALAVGLGLFITRIISKPVSELVQAANKASSGDLTAKIQINSKDEIGRLAEDFKIMLSQMRELVGQIVEKSSMVAGMSQQLTSNAQQTAAAATETAATVGEIASTIDQVSNNAQEVAALSQGVSSEARQGEQGIERVDRQMSAISASSGKASRVVESLTNTLNQVNQIVDLITHIADQTNLLALNAAIEAARAGEQGRGFAVVAEEVRKLAEQSGNAAKDINQLIGQVKKESNDAVEAMMDGNEQVKEGAAVVEDVGKSFRVIIQSIEGLAGQIQNVAAASEQVSAGVQNVASASEEQTAAMEEVSCATEQLTNMANELSQLVGKFKL